MFSHLQYANNVLSHPPTLFVAIASSASFRVVQNGFQASEPGLRSGQEDDAPTSNSASPAANGALGKVQTTNDNNEIDTTLGNTVATSLPFIMATLSNNAGGRPVAFALLFNLAQSSDASVANAAKAILIQELVSAVFTTLNELAGSNNATLVTAANDGLRLIEGMNDINEIATTLGNLVASNNAIIDQGTPGAQSAAIALLNKLARSNDSSVANAATASAARFILIKATKSQEEMVAAVFTTLHDLAGSDNATLAAVANDGLRLIEGMNDINEITTTLGYSFALGNAKPTAHAAALSLLDNLCQSNDASVANAARAILIQATKGQEEMVHVVTFAGAPHAVAYTPFGVTHSSNVGICTNVDGAVVPCHRKTLP